MALYALVRTVGRLRRVDLADLITAVIALGATTYAATGTWKYLSDAMHYGLDLKIPMVAVLEGAQVAEALRARKNIKEHGAAGVDGVGLWVLTGISAALSTSVAGNFREALGRAIIPAVGAWLWERALAPQRRAARQRRVQGPIRWRITPERVFVWLRLADAIDTDVWTADSARRVAGYLKATDREKRPKWLAVLTLAGPRAYRGRMRLIGDALRHGDPTGVHEKLSRAAFADALTRLGITESNGLPESPAIESPAESRGDSPVLSGGESLPLKVIQPGNILTPGDPVFAQVVANLPPAVNGTAKSRRTAPASAPARRQASVTARIKTDHESVAQTWLDSVAAGKPLSTRRLAKATGVSQATAFRVVSELRENTEPGTSGEQEAQS
ncbi:hypothetical protein [Catenulispora sp. MAP12-49]|uniref:hypothetical protein n=1 Tax=Catenulispora sp. MAP12-49 TaxID=3156302 RepID=UPI0035154BB1